MEFLFARMPGEVLVESHGVRSLTTRDPRDSDFESGCSSLMAANSPKSKSSGQGRKGGGQDLIFVHSPESRSQKRQRDDLALQKGKEVIAESSKAPHHVSFPIVARMVGCEDLEKLEKKT